MYDDDTNRGAIEMRARELRAGDYLRHEGAWRRVASAAVVGSTARVAFDGGGSREFEREVLLLARRPSWYRPGSAQ